MTDRAAPVSLAGSPLGTTRHVCALFGGDDEEYRVLLPFIKDGLDRGERAVHVVPQHDHDEHCRRLTAGGIDAAAAEARGQLDLRESADTYLRDDRFDAERLLADFGRMAGAFPRSRIVCRMGWAAGSRVRIDDVIDFESRVNDLWSRHDDLVICTYPIAQFGGDAIIDILRTHPMAIIGGMLHQNPFYVPPDEFLRGRHAGRDA
jgi:hypothetical protein